MGHGHGPVPGECEKCKRPIVWGRVYQQGTGRWVAMKYNDREVFVQNSRDGLFERVYGAFERHVCEGGDAEK